MINITNYSDHKAKGLISLSKLGSAFMISKKKFDADSGLELPSDVESINKSDLFLKREELRKSLEQLDIFIADVEKLV